MRAAFYGRYSTAGQKETSIEDQLRTVQSYAEGKGWTITKKYQDRAISGTEKNRPGYQAMLADAEAKKFDILIVDDLSRLHRDTVENELTIRRFKFWQIRLIGISDGFDSTHKSAKMLSAINGIKNDQFIDDLKEKTHRGLRGQLERGFSTGARIYGYKSAAVFDKAKKDSYGRPEIVAARREINPAEAGTIRLIFQLFADGHSPRQITLLLNEKGIPSPRGRQWNQNTIRGNPRDGHGILHNRLLVGEIIWNRTYTVKNPDTDKKKIFYRPEAEWIRKDAPHLRIINQPLWDAVQKRLATIHQQSEKVRQAIHTRARTGASPKFLFSGLLVCGVCGKNYVMIDKTRYGCNGHRKRGGKSCTNGLKVSRAKVESRLLEGIKSSLFPLEAIEFFKLKVTRLLKERRLKAQPDKVAVGKRLAQVEKEIERMVSAIRDGAFSKALQTELEKAEKEKDGLLARLKVNTKGLDKIVDFLPGAVGRYKRLLRNLDRTLQSDISKARFQLKTLLGDQIKMVPVNGYLEAEMVGSFDGLLSFSANKLLSNTTGGD